MAQPKTSDKPPASYRRTVDRIVDYLEGLPEEARCMWVDAAYRIHVESLLDDAADQELVVSAPAVRVRGGSGSA